MKRKPPQQLDLFLPHAIRNPPQWTQEEPLMDRPSLERWRQQVADYQGAIRRGGKEQMTLFDLPQTTWDDPDRLDPFSLKKQPRDFFRLPHPPAGADDFSDQGCLYFIIDHSLPILLYVGETKLTPSRRWKGTHDAKGYIAQYLKLHRYHGIETEVCAAFYKNIEAEKPTLLAWERHCILKWRSPFNKECWRYWGQPFTKS